MSGSKRAWIDDLELEDVQVKWGFSRFDGRKDDYNEEGERSFVIMLTEEKAHELKDQGWNVKAREGYEEGDPEEYHLEIKISFKFDDPMIYFLKDNGVRKRKIRANEEDLRDVKRATCDRIDVIVKPNFWERQGRSGITAYVKEMYCTITESKFAGMYDEYEEV